MWTPVLLQYWAGHMQCPYYGNSAGPTNITHTVVPSRSAGSNEDTTIILISTWRTTAYRSHKYSSHIWLLPQSSQKGSTTQYMATTKSVLSVQQPQNGSTAVATLLYSTQKYRHELTLYYTSRYTICWRTHSSTKNYGDRHTCIGRLCDAPLQMKNDTYCLRSSTIFKRVLRKLRRVQSDRNQCTLCTQEQRQC